MVPPNQGSFSATSTSSPALRAVIAAARPPAPEPATSTSHSKRMDHLNRDPALEFPTFRAQQEDAACCSNALPIPPPWSNPTA